MVKNFSEKNGNLGRSWAGTFNKRFGNVNRNCHIIESLLKVPVS
jgi:hypothetical protein